jgi:aminopeptidase N
MLFPNFDQPSIRSTWQLNVLAPNEWLVISNEQEQKEDKAAN